MTQMNSFLVSGRCRNMLRGWRWPCFKGALLCFAPCATPRWLAIRKLDPAISGLGCLQPSSKGEDSLVLKTVKFGFKNTLVLPILLRKKPRPRKNGWFAQSQSSLDPEMKLEHRCLPRASPFIICQGPSVYGWLKVSQSNSWPLS